MFGLRKTILQGRGAATIQIANRGFAGGGAKPKPIDPKTTDYDIVFVGKFSFLVYRRNFSKIHLLMINNSKK
jgi:hypothetical protein